MGASQPWHLFAPKLPNFQKWLCGVRIQVPIGLAEQAQTRKMTEMNQFKDANRILLHRADTQSHPTRHYRAASMLKSTFVSHQMLKRKVAAHDTTEMI